MKIVCSTNMPFVQEAFSTLGECRVQEGRHLTAADVKEVDLLALRSTTKVDRALLEGSKVRFVGTATIGTDHLDLAYLGQAGIHWCFAPGCNANSVSEYIVAALLTLGERHGFVLEGKTLGVVGVGNVGSRVVQKAQALGLRVLLNDPPRERQEGGAGGTRFASLDQVLAESDIVTLHVPLTRSGPDKTHHLADETFFRKARKGLILLNAARGPVVATPALLKALDEGKVSHVVLDTWEGEPVCPLDAMGRVDLGTPHIAGYSFEGKVMGTVMVYREACRFLGRPASWSHEPLMPPPLVPAVTVDAAGRTDESVLREVVRKLYDIEADDQRFRATAVSDNTQRGRLFDALRKDYPMRREFQYTRVQVLHSRAGLLAKLRGLGFLAG